MATGDGKTYLPVTQVLTNNTPALGATFEAINQQLVNNDSALMTAISQAIRDSIPSGIIGLAAVTPGSTSALNQFSFGNDEGYVNGWRALLQNNLVALDPPPAANVSPALPGSARDDLAFLELYWSQLNYLVTRIRVVDGVDFATYPEGINQTALVKAQGGAASPTTYTFAKSATDSGLYTAGDGSSAAQTALATADGYVYAIPLFRVRRRNTAQFDPDNNPLGANAYVSIADKSSGLNIAVGASGNLVFNNTNLPANTWYAGDYIQNTNNSQYAKITAISVGSTQTTVTVTNMGTTAIVSGWTWNSVAERPSGDFSNIVYSSDITDLRHQVSLTGFNMQALLEKNLDLLLRGQLTTAQQIRYGRDFIGLNLGGYTDDVNTLLFCKFDGSMAGTANGVAIPNTKVGTGTEAYANGVQGLGADFSAKTYGEQYSISIPSTDWTIEGFFKQNWGAGNPSTQQDLVCGFNGANRSLLIYFNGGFSAGFYDASNVIHSGVSIDMSNTKTGDVHYFKVTLQGSVLTIQLDEKVASINQGTNTPVATTSLQVGYSGAAYFTGLLDSFRVSNIVRTGTPLPTGYSYANGDRILDGPNTDFSQWSDDLGGTTGLGGRTNPYGLTRMPNQIAARVAFDGAEVRHYYGQGLTPRFTAAAIGSAPTGSLENASTEYVSVTANETPNGTITTFTFNQPTNAQGISLVYNVAALQIYVAGIATNTTSLTLNPSTGQWSATVATAPTSGQSVQLRYVNGGRHAHLIPSTKGFILHDWTDDSLSADGVKTTFQTTKYNVLNINHIRTAPTATPNTQTAQVGGFTVQGLSARGTINAAASGATQLYINGGDGQFFVGQNIRVQKGDGTWYTTTVSSIIDSYNIGVPATTVALSANAVIQGTAQVTFTSAPAAGTVDIVYESVLTPALGDYIRVMYQHIPYQGLFNGPAIAFKVVYIDKTMKQVSFGTGKVNIPSYGRYSTPITPNIPLSAASLDALLKSDALNNSLFTATRNLDYIFDKVPYQELGNASQNYYLIKEGNTLSFVANNFGTRGCCAVTNDISITGVDLSSSVPHLNTLSMVVADSSTGELYLFVASAYFNSTSGKIIADGGPGCASVDVFKLQGRPMIKGYGGVAA